MVWDRRGGNWKHKERSTALGVTLGQTSRRATAAGRAGSLGGAPIWVEHQPENFGPAKDDAAADPDGFAVFGRFPNGYLRHILRARRLGNVRRDELLHICSGTLGPDELWTVDIRAEARPRVQADGATLPFRDSSFLAVLIDPPYGTDYARALYKTDNPRPSWLLREAARVVVPCGRIGILHVAVPFSPPRCHLVHSWPVTTGVGFRVRTLTVYEREQEDLPARPEPHP